MYKRREQNIDYGITFKLTISLIVGESDHKCVLFDCDDEDGVDND